MTRARNRGATLVELIAFIVIAGVVATSLAIGLAGSLRRVGTAKQMTEGLQLAQERMELILARRDTVGWSCFTDDLNGPRFDPCGTAVAAGACPATLASAHPACSTTLGYTLTAALDVTGACMGGNVNYKCISVTVTHPESGQLGALQAAVAAY